MNLKKTLLIKQAEKHLGKHLYGVENARVRSGLLEVKAWPSQALDTVREWFFVCRGDESVLTNEEVQQATLNFKRA